VLWHKAVFGHIRWISELTDALDDENMESTDVTAHHYYSPDSNNWCRTSSYQSWKNGSLYT